MFTMLSNNFRWRLAAYFCKRSEYYIQKGDFKSIKKGLKFFKYSIIVLPNDMQGTKLKEGVRKSFKDVINKHKSKCSLDNNPSIN